MNASALAKLPVLLAAAVCVAACSNGPGSPAAPGARLTASGRQSPPQPEGRWQLDATVAIHGKGVQMTAVAPAGPRQAWAIGLAAGPGSQPGTPVIERWSGRSWQRVSIPARIAARFAAKYPPYAVMAASSPANAWAFNEFSGAWLHWNGRHWTEGSLPHAASQPGVIEITSTLALGPRDAWAFGGFLNNKTGHITPAAFRFNGTSWKRDVIPGRLALPISAASAASPTSIWAVTGRPGGIPDAAGPSGGTLLHWNGHQWRSVALPAAIARHGDPASVTALSSRDVWVGGGIADSSQGLTEVVAHWNARSWNVTRLSGTSPRLSYVVTAIIPSAPGGALALATCNTCQGTGNVSRLWRDSAGTWTGHASISITQCPAAFTSLARWKSSSALWATGFTGSGTAEKGLIASYVAART